MNTFKNVMEKPGNIVHTKNRMKWWSFLGIGKMPPVAVMWKAKSLKLAYLGVYEGKDVFQRIYGIEATVGIPIVYLYDGKTVSIEFLHSIYDKLIKQ